tara:strand:+ start:753 stop:1337 length:585 start_codon:yes stop_codon:yes gene_type:complete
LNISNIIHKNLPNILTIARILSIPVIIFFLFSNQSVYKVISLFLVFIFSLTDAIDGYYARTYNLVTNLGKYLDPLADKIFVLSLFLSLHIYFSDVIPLWMIFLIVFRDISVMSLRNVYSAKKIDFKTSFSGKIKTSIQLVSIHIILLMIIFKEYNLFTINLLFIYYTMLFCVIITLYSGLVYIFQYYKLVKNNE